MVQYVSRCEGFLDPIIAAASAAFGFVYIHPFFDGNGRIHRYLFHHVLARAGYNPPGLIFPISAVILERIEEYGEILRGYSGKILPLVEWEGGTLSQRAQARVCGSTAGRGRAGGISLPGTVCIEEEIGLLFLMYFFEV
jgi:Fic family protein